MTRKTKQNLTATILLRLSVSGSPDRSNLQIPRLLTESRVYILRFKNGLLGLIFVIKRVGN